MYKHVQCVARQSEGNATRYIQMKAKIRKTEESKGEDPVKRTAKHSYI